MCLFLVVKVDLIWWVDNVLEFRNLILFGKIDIEILCDVFKKGWGVVCNKVFI